MSLTHELVARTLGCENSVCGCLSEGIDLSLDPPYSVVASGRTGLKLLLNMGFLWGGVASVNSRATLKSVLPYSCLLGLLYFPESKRLGGAGCYLLRLYRWINRFLSRPKLLMPKSDPGAVPGGVDTKGSSLQTE